MVPGRLEIDMSMKEYSLEEMINFSGVMCGNAALPGVACAARNLALHLTNDANGPHATLNWSAPTFPRPENEMRIDEIGAQLVPYMSDHRWAILLRLTAAGTWQKLGLRTGSMPMSDEVLESSIYHALRKLVWARTPVTQARHWRTENHTGSPGTPSEVIGLLLWRFEGGERLLHVRNFGHLPAFVLRQHAGPHGDPKLIVRTNNGKERNTPEALRDYILGL